MPSHLPILKWTGLLFAFLLLMDALIGYNTFHHFATLHKDEPLELSLPLSFGMFLAVQLLLLWSFRKMRQLLTHYQRLKASYEQELNLTRQVMDCAGAGLGVLDEGGRLVYVNPALAQMLDQPADRMLGQSPAQFLNTSPALWQLEEAPAEFGTRLKQANGESVMVQVQKHPRWHAGRIVGSILSLMPFQDTT